MPLAALIGKSPNRSQRKSLSIPPTEGRRKPPTSRCLDIRGRTSGRAPRRSARCPVSQADDGFVDAAVLAFGFSHVHRVKERRVIDQSQGHPKKHFRGHEHTHRFGASGIPANETIISALRRRQKTEPIMPSRPQSQCHESRRSRKQPYRSHKTRQHPGKMHSLRKARDCRYHRVDRKVRHRIGHPAPCSKTSAARPAICNPSRSACKKRTNRFQLSAPVFLRTPPSPPRPSRPQFDCPATPAARIKSGARPPFFHHRSAEKIRNGIGH